MRAMSALVALCVLLPGAAAQADPVKLVAFELYPWMYAKDGTPAGSAVATVLEATADLPVARTIEFQPIPRILQSLAEDEAIVVALGRNAERESLGQWVAELFRDDYVFATTSDHPTVKNWEDAAKLRAIGSNSAGAPERLLKSRGLTNLESSNSVRLSAKKLEAGRIDAWFDAASGIRATWKAENFPADRLVIGPSMGEATLWVTASRKVAPELVEKLRANLAKLKTDGRYPQNLVN